MSDKIEVFVSRDSENKTWNITEVGGNCLKYGTAEDVDGWLFDHSQTHIEVEE